MKTIEIPFVDFPRQYDTEREEITEIVRRVFSHGQFVGGPEVEEFEQAISDETGVAHCVALNSGTDALTLALHVLGVNRGDEVITPPNSFYASTAVVVHLGALPVFADVGDDQNIDPAAIERAITPRTKAIMPVHLTGRIADMAPIMEIAERHGIPVIEDAAQSIGSSYKGRASGSFGRIGCFSGHPLKNMNAAGDAGFLITDDPDIAHRIRLLRNHGLEDRSTVVEWGFVSRMDTLQAAILTFRLSKLPAVVEARRRNVSMYRERLADCPQVYIPPCRAHEFNTFHTFVIQAEKRDQLQEHMHGHGIGTSIHYPTPIHLQPAARNLGYREGDFPTTERQSQRILSLPVHQFLSENDVKRVASQVLTFYG